MTYNAAERKDIRKAEKAAAQAERARRDFVTLSMSNSSGRAYFRHMLERCHVFRTTFSIDALQMAFAEGERNAGLQVLNDIMAWCPDQYILMMREATNDRYGHDDRSPTAEHSGSTPSGRDDQGRGTDDDSSFRDIDYDPNDAYNREVRD